MRLSSNFHVAAAAAGTTVSIPDLSASDTQFGSPAEARYRINRAGTCTNSPTSSPHDWATPATSTVGDGFWVRVTATSGTFSSGTTGSWIQLSSDRTWIVSQGSQGLKTCTSTIEIASDSGGVTIVDTRTGVILTAEYEE